MMDLPPREHSAAPQATAGFRRRTSENLRPRQRVVDSVIDPRSAEGLRPGTVRRVRHTGAEQTDSPSISGGPSKPASAPLRSAAEFCRQARRVRAVYGRHPVEMHRQLQGLRITDRAVDPFESAGRYKSFERPSRVAAAFGSLRAFAAGACMDGSALLGKLARWLRLAPRRSNPLQAGQQARGVRTDADDNLPRYTLVDPNEPTCDEAFTDSRDRTFGAMVMRTLQELPNAPLRYSQRLDLLKEAGRRGIGRFEANLMIAAAQHRMKSTAPREATPEPRRFGGVLAYVVMQTMILWGAWRVVRT